MCGYFDFIGGILQAEVEICIFHLWVNIEANTPSTGKVRLIWRLSHLPAFLHTGGSWGRVGFRCRMSSCHYFFARLLFIGWIEHRSRTMHATSRLQSSVFHRTSWNRHRDQLHALAFRCDIHYVLRIIRGWISSAGYAKASGDNIVEVPRYSDIGLKPLLTVNQMATCWLLRTNHHNQSPSSVLPVLPVPFRAQDNNEECNMQTVCIYIRIRNHEVGSHLIRECMWCDWPVTIWPR